MFPEDLSEAGPIGVLVVALAYLSGKIADGYNARNKPEAPTPLTLTDLEPMLKELGELRTGQGEIKKAQGERNLKAAEMDAKIERLEDIERKLDRLLGMVK